MAALAFNTAVTPGKQESGAGVIELDAAALFGRRNRKRGAHQQQRKYQSLEKPFSSNHGEPTFLSKSNNVVVPVSVKILSRRAGSF